MATYKLIQDIEAEDHILGPLSLRQFIFALAGAFCWYLSFIIFVKHVYFLLAITAPPAIFCTFFAVPFGRDQPTEVWFLAKLRFWFKPRQRIWDQSGVKELVTITVPKKVERVLTKGFSQNEVHSRLKALANTLDSRGWAVKNVNLETYTPMDLFNQSGSDRLIGINSAPQQVPAYDVQASDDILDETSNPVAQQFQTMINQSSQQHRQHLIDEMNEIRSDQAQAAQTSSQPSGWFMSPPAAKATGAAPINQPSVSGGQQVSAAADDSMLAAQLKAQGSSKSLSNSHMRTLAPLPIGNQPLTPPAAPVIPAANYQQPAGPAAPDPAILSLANNNDLSVSTLARQAYKAKHDDEPPQDEVVVSLHQ